METRLIGDHEGPTGSMIETSSHDYVEVQNIKGMSIFVACLYAG